MKRLCFFAVLMALCSSAYAGGSISFTVGGHRVHIESSRHCRSTSCASVSVSGVNERRSRSITDREEVTPVRDGATGVADRFATAGARDHAAGPDDRRPAAGRLQAGRIDNANRRAAAGAPAACSTGLHSLAATSAAASTGCKAGRTRAAAGAGRKGFA